MIELKPFTIAPGDRFGKLTVRKRCEDGKTHRGPKFRVRCDCHRTFFVKGSHLRKMKVTSCDNCAGKK